MYLGSCLHFARSLSATRHNSLGLLGSLLSVFICLISSKYLSNFFRREIKEPTVTAIFFVPINFVRKSKDITASAAVVFFNEPIAHAAVALRHCANESHACKQHKFLRGHVALDIETFAAKGLEDVGGHKSRSC